MSERCEWINRGADGNGGPLRGLRVAFSPPSESLADMVHHMGFQSVGVRDQMDFLPAFRKLKPDLLLLGSSVSSEKRGALLGLLGHEKQGFPVLCISDGCERPAMGMSQDVNLAFLPETFRPTDLKKAIERLIGESQNLEPTAMEELDALIVGKTPAMVELKRRILQVAQSDLTVLITGESGTGKEVVARAIHEFSARFRNPFVKVNSAGLPTELFESELFGYQKGAFTGAFKNKPGKFQLADSGTIFLDEVGEIPLALQAKLLHALEDNEFSPLGSTRNTRVDTRVLAATNARLNRMVQSGKFRLDLFYRLSVVCLHIPPLRERREDIPLFCDHFLRKYAGGSHVKSSLVPEHIQQRFGRFNWPGNVRQLENAVRSVVALGNADNILPDSNTHLKRYTLKEVCKEAVVRAEKKIIEDVLIHTGWNRKEAAMVLKTSYRNLLNKIKEYGIVETSGFPLPVHL